MTTDQPSELHSISPRTAVKEAIIDLYLNVKIRNPDEVSAMTTEHVNR